ncbi:PAS domain-containing protein [uncultured Roseobacter sp.]|uniref:helix-turn-helix transcriptional regulator n=1 Tax=uncultured Roseobacter sp. TaxID=114847 RepID=UPI00263A1F41|nr:PAS domain-containing protein [uncultured Roseobacter sp.]
MRPNPKSAERQAFARAVVQLFSPFCEVVLHDLTSGTVAYVDGLQSGRETGDPSYLEELGVEDWTEDVHGPYRKTMPDGRAVKSISVVLRDAGGAADGLLCINVDMSQFETAKAVLAALTSVPASEAEHPLANDWVEDMHGHVASWCTTRGILLKDLQPGDRQALLSELARQGTFERKRAAQSVARALGVSRATVYQDLKTISVAQTSTG